MSTFMSHKKVVLTGDYGTMKTNHSRIQHNKPTKNLGVDPEKQEEKK